MPLMPLNKYWPLVVATIFMLVFPCATCAQEVSSLPKETEDRTYRPEFEFFVDFIEAEAAEAAVGQLLRSPSGKPALDELRNIEKMMLIGKWSPEKWEIFWEKFASNAGAAGLKTMEVLPGPDLSQQAKFWTVLEHVRLMLIAYTPLATSPGKLQLVNSGLKNGSCLIKGIQERLQRNPLWSSADDEAIHNLVTGYKLMAFSRKGEDQ